jgi:hypothetical protein
VKKKFWSEGTSAKGDAKKISRLSQGAWDWIWMGAVGLVLGASAQAAKIYSFTGKISHITGNEVQVTQGSEAREFGTSGLSAEQRDSLRIGDVVTLWFTLEAQGMTRQQAGQAKGLRNSSPSDEKRDLRDQGSDPDESPWIPPAVQDDRAFYNARVDWNSNSNRGA